MKPAAVAFLVLAALAARSAPFAGADPPKPAPSVARIEAMYAAGDLAAAVREGQALLAQPLDPAERIKVLNYLGAGCYQLARYGEGIAYLQQALALLAQAGAAESDRVSLLNDLGESQRAAGQLSAAVQTLEQALAAAERSAPRTELHAVILNSIAGLARDRGDFARAEQLLDESLQITESLPDIGGDRLATAHLNLAELLRSQSRFDESRPHYEAALRVAREAFPPDHPNLVYFLNQFAVLRSELGQFAAADTLRQEALRILGAQEEVPYPVLQAMVLSDAASDLVALGRPRDAVRLYEHALALRHVSYNAQHWEVGTNLAQLARAELETQAVPPDAVAARATEAIAILDRTPVAPESRADAYAVRALASLRAGNQDGARRDLDQAIDIVEALRANRGGGDESRARLLSRNASYYDAAIDLALKRGDVARALSYAERFRARALEEQLLLDRQRLLAAVDPKERGRLQSDQRAAEAKLVSLQDAQLQMAYDASLTEKQRAAKLRQLQSDLESAVRAYTASQEQIRAHSPAWQTLVRQHDTASLQQLQSQLMAGELLLLYWVGPAHAWLMEVPALPGQARAHVLTVAAADAAALGVAPGELTLAKLSDVLAPSARGFGAGPLFEPVRGISQLMDLPAAADSSAVPASPTDVDARLFALWHVLVPPGAWERIRAAAEVTIIPAGPLHQLPFEALEVQPVGSGTARYWLDEGPPVRYAVSATTLLQLQHAARTPHRYPVTDVLSVSNPTLGSGESESRAGASAPGAGTLRSGGWSRLPSLPGTEHESDLVREAFGAQRVRVLSADAATETAVRAQCADKRYLHLATHGVVDEATSDVLAGLVLTREGPEPSADGRLQLYEIDGLRLTAQLAVLSACRTAAGKQIESEGVFALARGFHVAGATRVIASLWSVSDASTASLMGAFFGDVAQAERGGHRVDYARALRDAKRSIRAQAQWTQPFYWAPFVLSGAR